jgi:hypothetical protein
VPEQDSVIGEWTKRESAELMLGVLETRRGAFDQAMWHAPALTIAAQAFLLIVLTDRSVDGWARAGILVAGVVATTAAVLSLLRLRAREVQYSKAIAYFFDSFGLPDPRIPDKLPQKEYVERTSRLDQWLQRWARKRDAPVYLWWALALLLFVLADTLALLLTV